MQEQQPQKTLESGLTGSSAYVVKVSTEKMALDSAELLFEGLEGDVKDPALDFRGLASRGCTVSAITAELRTIPAPLQVSLFLWTATISDNVETKVQRTSFYRFSRCALAVWSYQPAGYLIRWG